MGIGHALDCEGNEEKAKDLKEMYFKNSIYCVDFCPIKYDFLQGIPSGHFSKKWLI